MRNSYFVSALLAAGVLVASVASAQDCAAPTAIPGSGGAGVAGDTCAAGNPFPQFPGGIPSPQNDVVYSFVAQGANATVTVAANGSPLLPGFVVLTPCDPVAGNPVAFGSNAAGTATGAVSGLTDGTTYYLVVTTDPGAGAANNNCGTYNFSYTGTLPVSLQNFSVD
jgi:hypothetical protein